MLETELTAKTYKFPSGVRSEGFFTMRAYLYSLLMSPVLLRSNQLHQAK